jgi:exonuclease-1
VWGSCGSLQACDELKVEFLVAPYEADAQLAFLQLNGHVDAVITEDSDLMVFGCRETLYKFDREFGSCTRIKLSKVNY